MEVQWKNCIYPISQSQLSDGSEIETLVILILKFTFFESSQTAILSFYIKEIWGKGVPFILGFSRNWKSGWKYPGFILRSVDG